MDDSFHIEEGMQKAREFLLAVTELGLPTGTEALDPIAPQYLGDLIAWTAIGARTSESQTHREMSSGLSTPVGFKNATDGDIEPAINAIKSAASPHSFLGINMQGRSSIVRTAGQPYGHVVLRGGDGRSNFDTVSVCMAERALAKAKIAPNIVIDCSHANSLKDPALQPLVMSDVRAPDPRRQPVHRRPDDREQHRGRQPADPRGPLAAEVRLLGNRRLRRLAHHRNHDPQGPRGAEGHPAEPQRLITARRIMSLIKPFRGLRPAPGRAGEIAAPPYDVLSADEARSPRRRQARTASCTSPRPRSTCRRKSTTTRRRSTPSRARTSTA
jgi:hypothetical protein